MKNNELVDPSGLTLPTGYGHGYPLSEHLLIWYIWINPATCVMLKLVPVQLHHQKRMRKHSWCVRWQVWLLIIASAVEELLNLKTIRNNVVKVRGMAVSFEVSVSVSTQPQAYHYICQTFNATQIHLAEQSCPANTLIRKYTDLKVQPRLLIGSDHPHVITPIQPVRFGPTGSDSSCLHDFTHLRHLILTRTSMLKDWGRWCIALSQWQEVTRSKHDQAALSILDEKTIRVKIDGVLIT